MLAADRELQELGGTAGPDKIPFNRPCLVGTEAGYIQQAVENLYLAGDGPFGKRCEALLEQALGVSRALLTTSCTHALDMAGLLLNIRPCDEVIVPSFTFVSSINAFVLRGAQPVFADIRADTLNLDERQLEALITPRTRAVVAVHYGGIGCEMESIMATAARHGIAIVEDNAHGLFGKYKGRWLGSFGSLATQSFHETKNIQCGEGGALLINDPLLIQRAEIVREKGTDRSRFFRGEVDKYTWVDLGSSFVISDVLAALLYAQLEASGSIQQRRGEIWQRYWSGLRKWADGQGVRLPIVPLDCEQSYHLFYLLFPSSPQRDRFIAHLRKRNIYAVFHYLPLHSSPMGIVQGGSVGQCPVTESVSERLVRLPFYSDLSEADQERVIEAILEFSC